MSCHKDWFDELQEQSDIEVTVANNETIRSSGVGEVKLETRNGTKVISDVVLVPELKTNLLSVSKMVKKGYAVTFAKNGCTVYKQMGFSVSGEAIVTASEYGGLYKVDVVQEKAYFTGKNDSEHQLWHRRLGHLNNASMNLLKNGMANGISFSSTKINECVVCALGKQNRQPFKNSDSRADQKLQLVHTDICGAMPRESWSGARYVLTFIDDCTRKIFIYFLKAKSEVYEKFKEFQIMVENQTECRIKTLRSDNGTEYVNNKFQQYLKSKGIIHQTTVPYTPEQNGVAERTNRSIVEKARCLLQEGKCNERMWAEAINATVYLKNRSPHRSVNGVPEELWSNKKIDLSHLKVFGCLAHSHVPEQQRRKFDAKSKPYTFVGYCEETKGYRLFDRESKKIIKSRNVIFYENQFDMDVDERKVSKISSILNVSFFENNSEYDSGENTTGRQLVRVRGGDEERNEVNSDDSDHEEEFCEAESEIFNEQRESNNELNVNRSVSPISAEIQTSESIGEKSEVKVNQDSKSSSADANKMQSASSSAVFNQSEVRRSNRQIKPTKFPDYVSYCAIANPSAPTTVQEALNSDERHHWQSAMDEEYQALMDNNAWVLVEKPDPEKKKIVQCKWVFAVKDNVSSEKRYKARLVAKGFTQQYGIDFTETFSPVVRNSTIKMLFALSVLLNLTVDHVDVSTAFLNGELTEKIFMYQPEGFNFDKSKVCLLKKALYGLKQASRVWNKKVEKVLLKAGYNRSEFESCVYFKCVNGCIVFIAVYVDDFLIFTNNENEKCNVKRILVNNFKLKDLGSVKRCVELNIHTNHATGDLTIDQSHYITELIHKFGLSEAKIASTPIEAGLKLDKGEKCDVSIPYQCLIGSLMYLAVNTRPDIAYTVSYLSQFNTCYTDVHFKHAKRVLRYLKGTLNLALTFKKDCKEVNV